MTDPDGIDGPLPFPYPDPAPPPSPESRLTIVDGTIVTLPAEGYVGGEGGTLTLRLRRAMDEVVERDRPGWLWVQAVRLGDKGPAAIDVLVDRAVLEKALADAARHPAGWL